MGKETQQVVDVETSRPKLGEAVLLSLARPRDDDRDKLDRLASTNKLARDRRLSQIYYLARKRQCWTGRGALEGLAQTEVKAKKGPCPHRCSKPASATMIPRDKLLSRGNVSAFHLFYSAAATASLRQPVLQPRNGCRAHAKKVSPA